MIKKYIEDMYEILIELKKTILNFLSLFDNIKVYLQCKSYLAKVSNYVI